MSSTPKDYRDHFIALENESRKITAALANLAERRVAVTNAYSTTVLGKFEKLPSQFDVWVIGKAEELMAQLREVVTEMSVVRRKVAERDNDQQLAFELDQEYHRKLQLLETLKNMGEFNVGEDVEFFSSFRQAWRSDSTYGCFKF